MDVTLPEPNIFQSGVVSRRRGRCRLSCLFRRASLSPTRFRAEHGGDRLGQSPSDPARLAERETRAIFLRSARYREVPLKLALSSLLVMPDSSTRAAKRVRSTFDTLEREKNFKHPPKDASVVPILNEFVTPHLESFNALFDDSGLPSGDGDGRGLLHLGIADIGKRVVFDGKGDIGSESGQKGWGNRLSSECFDHSSL